MTKPYAVHRLVAQHFIPNPHGHHVVCHNDGDQANNCADNLRWDTQSENMLDVFRHGGRANRTVGRLTDEQTRAIQESDLTLRELAAIFNVHPVTISKHRHRTL